MLFSGASEDIEVYTPDGQPDIAWKPSVVDWNQSDLKAGQTYTVKGKQLNGLSQAVSYGDDAQMATNYPLVSLAFNNTGHVYYCRTFGFSTMGVATGDAEQSFQFEVPYTLPEAGPAALVVSVNGIPSDKIELIAKAWKSLKNALMNQHISIPTSIRQIAANFGLVAPISIWNLIGKLGNGNI